MRNSQKGFTLIELLVVIAIIGILATIVLTSLGSARAKAGDARVQAQLSNMRAQAQLWSRSSGWAAHALGTCATTASSVFEATNNGLGNLFPSSTFTNTACYSNAVGPTDSSFAWAVSWPMSSGWFCVDSTGTARSATSGGTAYTGASGASPAAITTTTCN